MQTYRVRVTGYVDVDGSEDEAVYELANLLMYYAEGVDQMDLTVEVEEVPE